MAGAIMNKVWDLFGMDTERDAEEVEEKTYDNNDYDTYDGYDEEENDEIEDRRIFGKRNKEKVVSMPQTQQIKMVISQPTTFDQSEEICEFLLDELHKDDNKDFNSCWSGAIYLWLRRYGDEAMLDGEDREVLKLLMQDALTTDAHGQEKLFRLKKSQLEERRAAAGEKRKKNQKLFRSIGFLIGVLISILIY